MNAKSEVTINWAGDAYKAAFVTEMLDGYMRSAERIRDDAKGRIHNVSGELARTTRVGRSTEQNAAFVFSGSRRERIYYPHFVEFGTYNSKAYPYMRPAMDSNFNATLAEAERTGKRILNKERRMKTTVKAGWGARKT